MHSRLGLSKQIPPSCSGPRLPLGAPILLFSSAHLKHSGKEGSTSHLRWGSQDMLWASRQGSGKAEHWKLFFQAEVKSTELCSTATVLGWQYFFTVFFVNVSEDLWVCVMGYSVWVLKHEHSVKQDILPRRNPWQIRAVFFGAQPSKHVLLTSHELEVIPMCIPLHCNLPHVNVSKVCLSISVSIFYMGRQVAWGSSSKGWEKYSGKQHSLDIEG